MDAEPHHAKTNSIDDGSELLTFFYRYLFFLSVTKILNF